MKWLVVIALSLHQLNGLRSNSCEGKYSHVTCYLDVESDKPVEYKQEPEIHDEPVHHITFSDIKGSIGKQTLSSLMPETEKLEFNNGDIKEIEEGGFCSLPKVKSIIIAFMALPTLTGPMFSGCNNLKSLKIVAARFVPNISTGLGNLEELYLIRQNPLNLTREYLEPLKNLQKLEISDSHVQQIESSILCSSPKLKTLIITGNTGLGRVTKSTFENCHNVEYFSFLRNPRTAIDSEAFSSFSNVKELHIDYLDILHMKQQYIPSFNNVENLTLLNAAVTWIEPEFYSNFPKLKKLRLGSEKISSLDPTMLSLFPNLIELDLEYHSLSSIDDIRHPNLEVLNVRYNKISKVNADAVKINLPKLKILNIGCNHPLGYAGEDALQRELEGITVIKSAWRCLGRG